MRRRRQRRYQIFKLIEEIIRKADVCRIAFANDNIPYIVTMNFGYTGDPRANIVIFIVQMKEENLK